MRFDADLLVRLRRLGAFDLSPDGRWLVTTLDELSRDGKTYDTNLYRLDLERPDAGLVALTSDTRPTARPRFGPDGRLGFLAAPDPATRARPETDDGARGARGGEEGAGADGGSKRDQREDESKKDEEKKLQVHVMPVDGGAPRVLTDLPGGVVDFRWTADGRRLVLLARVDPRARDLAHDRELARERAERGATGELFDVHPMRYWDHFIGPAHAHLLVGDADGGGLRDLTPGLSLSLEECEWDVSPDGRSACLDWWVRDEEGRLRGQLGLVDLETGERRMLTGGTSDHVHPRFSPDGRHVACLHQPNEPRVTGKRDLMLVDADSGESRILTAEVDLWPDQPRWIDATRIAYEADSKGRRLLRLHDVESQDDRALTDSGACTHVRRVKDGGLIFKAESFDAPAELFAMELGDSASETPGPVRQLTRVNADVLEGHALSAGTSHVVRGSKGDDVQLWEVRPPDFDESREHPLLLWIHGGPLGAYTDGFHYRWNPQVFAARGHVVIMVNPRGSTGFGQAFIEDHCGEWGSHCHEDLMRAVDEWVERPYVDPDRVAALGGSFGGWMVNWIAGHEDRFRCLVSHAGLFDMRAFHGSSDMGPHWELEFGGSPWAHPELYEKWSPCKHVESFETPTLVIHGEKDYRVPLSEGLSMFCALQRQGVPSRFLYFPDENHWILAPPNMKLWNETVLDWLDEHLGTTDAASDA